MLLQEVVGDVRPCLMNIEWLVYGNIDAPDELLQCLAIGRELGQLANQLRNRHALLYSAFLQKGGNIIRKIHDRGHTGSIPASIQGR